MKYPCGTCFFVFPLSHYLIPIRIFLLTLFSSNFLLISFYPLTLIFSTHMFSPLCPFSFPPLGFLLKISSPFLVFSSFPLPFFPLFFLAFPPPIFPQFVSHIFPPVLLTASTLFPVSSLPHSSSFLFPSSAQSFL